ncbi:unnamed protein product [Parnassius apollo]|uniref:(apollo) hypothetical protein n=1 Tax=Parnassius apollo TaxID=110799 RepID=A0A8S3WWK4_PARAO|nr:unnamed protein product [Parnassius apollo]
MRAPPQAPARSHNGKRLGAHVISESESVTHFLAIQVYVSARLRHSAGGCGAGGGPLTQLRAVPQQGRVAAPAACLRSHNRAPLANAPHTHSYICEKSSACGDDD